MHSFWINHTYLQVFSTFTLISFVEKLQFTSKLQWEVFELVMKQTEIHTDVLIWPTKADKATRARMVTGCSCSIHLSHSPQGRCHAEWLTAHRRNKLVFQGKDSERGFTFDILEKCQMSGWRLLVRTLHRHMLRRRSTKRWILTGALKKMNRYLLKFTSWVNMTGYSLSSDSDERYIKTSTRLLKQVTAHRGNHAASFCPCQIRIKASPLEFGQTNVHRINKWQLKDKSVW